MSIDVVVEDLVETADIFLVCQVLVPLIARGTKI